MEDKSNRNSELPAREQWRNLWDALSEETTVEHDISYPQAEQVKHELLEGLTHDTRAHVTPSEISSALEQTGRAAGSETEPLRWPEAKEQEQSSESKARERDVKPEQDIDHDR